MPVQIDQMTTSVEITPPSSPTAAPVVGQRREPGPPGSADEAVRDMVGRVMADELDRFLRNRGM